MEKERLVCIVHGVAELDTTEQLSLSLVFCHVYSSCPDHALEPCFQKILDYEILFHTNIFPYHLDKSG